MMVNLRKLFGLEEPPKKPIPSVEQMCGLLDNYFAYGLLETAAEMCITMNKNRWTGRAARQCLKQALGHYKEEVPEVLAVEPPTLANAIDRAYASAAGSVQFLGEDHYRFKDGSELRLEDGEWKSFC